MICSSSSCYYELSFGRQAQIGARGRFDSQKRSLLMRRVYKSFSLCIGRSPGGDFITVFFVWFLFEDSNLWLFCVLGISKQISVARHLLLLFLMCISEL